MLTKGMIFSMNSASRIISYSFLSPCSFDILTVNLTVRHDRRMSEVQMFVVFVSFCQSWVLTRSVAGLRRSCSFRAVLEGFGGGSAGNRVGRPYSAQDLRGIFCLPRFVVKMQ